MGLRIGRVLLWRMEMVRMLDTVMLGIAIIEAFGFLAARQNREVGSTGEC